MQLTKQEKQLSGVSLTSIYLMQNRVTEEIYLDPVINQTGSVWHVFVKVDFKDMLYGYKFDGKFSPEEGHYYDPSRIVLDPYGKVGDLQMRCAIFPFYVGLDFPVVFVIWKKNIICLLCIGKWQMFLTYPQVWLMWFQILKYNGLVVNFDFSRQLYVEENTELQVQMVIVGPKWHARFLSLIMRYYF